MTAKLLRSWKRPIAFFLLGDCLWALTIYWRVSVLQCRVGGVQFDV